MISVDILRFPLGMLRRREHHAPAARKVAQGTILCIDSYRTALATLERILAEAGYRVFTATNLPDALAICSKHHVDVAILDCGMTSGGHGVCMAEQLRSVQRDVQFVVWSGSHHNQRVRRCQNVNLWKPVRAPEMLQRLEVLLPHSSPSESNSEKSATL